MAIADGENGAVGELFARFYNVLLQKKYIEAEQDAVKTSELHLREVSRMCDVGLANRLEVIRAQQQLAENRAALATARGAFEAANISLMNYMGIEPGARRAVDGELYEPAIKGSRAESLALASQFRADRRQLEEQIKYQTNQIKIERSEMLPQVTAGFSAGWLSPYRQRDESSDTWRAEVRLSIPIFDRNVTRRAVMEAKAVRELRSRDGVDGNRDEPRKPRRLRGGAAPRARIAAPRRSRLPRGRHAAARPAHGAVRPHGRAARIQPRAVQLHNSRRRAQDDGGNDNDMERGEHIR